METEAKQSLLGLEREQSVVGKLFLFLTTLIVGPLLGLLLFAVVMEARRQGPGWGLVAQLVVESLAVFWLSLLIFIWWRPKWLQRHYFAIEWKVVFIVRVVVLVSFLWIGWIIVRGG